MTGAQRAVSVVNTSGACHACLAEEPERLAVDGRVSSSKKIGFGWNSGPWPAFDSNLGE